jgi:glycosyltransferase involved in cell wall biosynthesis
VAACVSVIVATYNRYDALDAVLRGLSKQTDRDFEVVVADDGSGPSTARVIGEWQRHFADRLIHVWQPDEGFRLAEIRNRAVGKSAGDYLVFLDGDCIPPGDFVAQHRHLAEEGRMVCGHRLMLSEPFTRHVLQERLEIENWGLRQWLAELRRGSIDRHTPLLRVPGSEWRRHLIRNDRRKVRGCNMAIWRSDFVNVDGFDATFIGWGHEDQDLAVRLGMLGITLKDGRWATGVLHLWHPPADRAKETSRYDWIAASLTEGRVRAVRGFSTLNHESWDNAD